jgi:hypothetical protein
VKIGITLSDRQNNEGFYFGDPIKIDCESHRKMLVAYYREIETKTFKIPKFLNLRLREAYNTFKRRMKLKCTDPMF